MIDETQIKKQVETLIHQYFMPMLITKVYKFVDEVAKDMVFKQRYHDITGYNIKTVHNIVLNLIEDETRLAQTLTDFVIINSNGSKNKR